VYSRDRIDAVLELGAAGRRNAEISRVTGIPPRTVRRWLAGDLPGNLRPHAKLRWHDVLEPHAYRAYAYLLGIYLGDGHLSQMRRGVFRLFVVLDARYPGVVSEVCFALRAVLPVNRVNVTNAGSSNSARVCSYSKSWPLLLPQHGPGPKHTRNVSLRDWQSRITREYARELIRGLIHSDGCRFVARQPTSYGVYSYPRYCFTNRSADIIETFCNHLDLLGIDWTLCSRDTIQIVQIARKHSVARLDEFVGPKR
jgi:hypothetical protein